MAITINPIIINNSILDQSESNLVPSTEMTRYFGLPQDYVQLFVYSNTNNLININNNFQRYYLTNNKEITFDPALDIEEAGYRLGTYKMVYNFLRPILTDDSSLSLFIKSISADRTELKIAASIESNVDYYSNIVNYINLIQQRDYFIEFYLDFGNNNLIPALSIAAEQEINGGSYAIIKLVDPLPQNYIVNSSLNIVEKVVDTKEYEAILTVDPIVPQFPSLREANFSLDIDPVRIGSSDYYNYNQIITQTGSNSQFQQLLGYISASNPRINVDYTNYSNFIHFGSAVQILETFKNQLEKIQTYEGLRSSLPPTDPNYIIYTGRINEILQQFNGYENYLYNESSSFAWPKYPGDKPYTNYSVTSSQAILWYNQQYESASYYDEFNNNYLVYGLPAYLQESPTFDYVKPFVNSMGQLFDDIWIYIKAMTDLWKAENALNDGISKDIVADALQSLGIHLYTDGDQDNLYEWLYGVDSSGSYFFPTQSWQTGVTASKYTMSGQDEAKSIFKRFYANLPTLLKSKGTNKFINYLNTAFGIPETILFPMEFGGIDKSSDTAEYNYSRFTAALQFSPYRYTYIDNATGNPYGVTGLEFRFKPTSLNTSSIQTLLISANHTTPSPVDWGFILTPTNVNGYEYANVTLYNNGITSSVSLPIFVPNSDNDYNWWNIIWQNEGTGSIFYVKNELNGEIGFSVSASHPSPIYDSVNNRIELGNVNTLYSTTLPSFFGSGNCYCQLQELRGWTAPLNESAIDAHTLNPESYIGNTTSSAYDNLLFRFPLGNDLYTNFGVVTGSQPQPNSNYFLYFYGIWDSSDYVNFTEQYYTQPAIGGYSIPNTDKIRIESQTLATNRLQPLKSVVYNNPTASRTTDIHLTQVGFSPQDQINNDIIAQLGNTYNLDQIIGDPRFSNLNSYPGLEFLQEEYFEKYIAPYNYKDFIQLIETFHKSLFRYLEDYVPGRSNNATGVIIKPHILERSKTRRYEPTINTASYDGQTWTVTITGSNPGEYCCTRNSAFNEAFFDGEFSGSTIPVDSYYEQNNPFTKAICDCHRYQVTSDQTFLYAGCNGEIKSQVIAGPSYEVNQIYACAGPNNIVFPLGGQPIIQDLGRFAEGQAFVEQYEGWDALNNNVEQNVISQFKKSKQPSLQDLFGPCYRTYIQNNTASPINYQYTSCNGITQTGIINTLNFIDVTSVLNSVTSSSGVLDIDYYENINTQVTSSYQWQDTNLSDTGYVRTREIGSSTTSSGFNQNMISSSIGEVPNVELDTSYMLYYDWVTSSIAEKYNTTNFHIRYLVDETGSVYNPAYNLPYYWNTNQSFGKNTPVEISLYDPLTQRVDTSLETTTYMPLKIYKPILYSDRGSRGTKIFPGYFGSMSFVDPNQDLVNDFQFQARRSGDITPIVSSGGVGNNYSRLANFNLIEQDNKNGATSPSTTYTFYGTSAYKTAIYSKIRIFKHDGSISSGAGCNMRLRLTRIRNGVSSAIYYSSVKTIKPSNESDSFDLEIPDEKFDFIDGDQIQVYIEFVFFGGGAIFRLGWSDDEGILSIQTNTNFINSLFSTSLPFAENKNGNWLLDSKFNDYYGSGQIQNPNISGSTLNSGFSEPIPFEFKKYDEVRFGQKENQVYYIMTSSLITTGSVQRRLVEFDRPLTGSIDPNFFVVRRLVDNSSFVIINGKNMKAPGFIIPKYSTDLLKNNIPTIISKLSSEGLIP